ncbi:Transcription initiation factor TFIID subunit 8 [Nakaseomyces glabratus]|uniref:Transcription initiation factor TFIID subunit 8 n=1 Tax=Candida glabrata TaxID=5478 RepID=A0A0W0EFA3_CANGB|nr:Transcription factor TFIID complex subunit 8 C-term [Nakaseomyces glabratus]KAH7598224.1 Transcription factor TFIID complex subunit 8 C-term [Nakaseomyces glabratus]KAI8400831.1 Transcription factor TFIID complex subunit 8 C-term [Nakaseomyces glabratus]KTB03882.1 Transcription initiation factor TFIID subunit 8 [Nakaseomyces glabratus]KTB05323.1 Transcription initiation factor TFIID subunit 8 [Nakaseomyces glabratus]
MPAIESSVVRGGVQENRDVDIKEINSSNRMDYQMVELLKRAVGVQLQTIDKDVTVTRMAMDQLVLFAEDQLNALVDGLHRISLLQRRQSIAVSDLEIWMRGYNLLPSDLYMAAEESKFIRENYRNDTSAVFKDINIDNPMESALGRINIQNKENIEPTDNDVDIDEDDDYELIELQQHAMEQLFKTDTGRGRNLRYKPGWLPDFPPDHTYKYTPSYVNVVKPETEIRQKLVEEGRLSEKALVKLMSNLDSISTTKDNQKGTHLKQENNLILSEESNNLEVQSISTDKPDDVGSLEDINKQDDDKTQGNKIDVDAENKDQVVKIEENKESSTEKATETATEKATEKQLSEEELADLEIKALLYRIENNKEYLIEPMRVSLVKGVLKDLDSNPTSKLKDFDVEAYARQRIEIARRKVVDFEYEQLYLKYNPLLRLAKMKYYDAEESDFETEYQKCIKRTMDRFKRNIPIIKEKRKMVRKESIKRKDELIAKRLATIKEAKMKKEQEIVRKSREMEAIENANKFGILPGEKPLEVLQDASNASTGESSTTTAQIPQGAPLLVNPVNSTLVPLVDSEKPKPLEEVQTIDVIAKDVEDDDEDLGLFGGFNSSSDDEEIDQNKETQESPTKKTTHVKFELGESDSDKDI